MTNTLTDLTPAIVMMPEQDVLKKFQWELVSYKVWAPLDLQEWLEDQGLSEYEASNYMEHLIDYMLENELGYEYGGITPWMGEGYTLY
jgi:hypothetical protein